MRLGGLWKEEVLNATVDYMVDWERGCARRMSDINFVLYLNKCCFQIGRDIIHVLFIENMNN